MRPETLDTDPPVLVLASDRSYTARCGASASGAATADAIGNPPPRTTAKGKTQRTIPVSLENLRNPAVETWRKRGVQSGAEGPLRFQRFICEMGTLVRTKESPMASEIDSRLKALGIDLPAPPTPAANYVPTVTTGKLVFVSGQVPMTPQGVKFVGKVGREFTVEEGREAARLCAINVLGCLKAALGDLGRIA